MSRALSTWMRRMRRLKENGYMKPPPLYDFINSPTLSGCLSSLPQRHVSPSLTPQTRSYPEDVYVQAIYDKYPDIKSAPIELNSFTPPLARRFAWRQMEFIQEGHSAQEAFDLAEQYFQEEIHQTQESMRVAKSSSRIVQEEEERVLQRALHQHRTRKERQLQSSVQS